MKNEPEPEKITVHVESRPANDQPEKITVRVESRPLTDEERRALRYQGEDPGFRRARDAAEQSKRARAGIPAMLRSNRQCMLRRSAKDLLDCLNWTAGSGQDAPETCELLRVLVAAIEERRAAWPPE